MLRRRVTFASTDNSTGQPILRIDDALGPTDAGSLLAALRLHFGGREIEMHMADVSAVPTILDIKSEAPFDYVVFALPRGLCQVSQTVTEPQAAAQSENYILAAWEATDVGETRSFIVSCSEGATIGWARTTLPPYVN